MKIFTTAESAYFESLDHERFRSVREEHNSEVSKIDQTVPAGSRFSRHVHEVERFGKKTIETRVSAYLDTCQRVSKFPQQDDIAELRKDLSELAIRLSGNLPRFYRSQLSPVPVSLVEKCEETLRNTLLQHVGIALAPVFTRMNEGNLVVAPATVKELRERGESVIIRRFFPKEKRAANLVLTVGGLLVISAAIVVGLRSCWTNGSRPSNFVKVGPDSRCEKPSDATGSTGTRMTNKEGITFVYIAPCSFMMGTNDSDAQEVYDYVRQLVPKHSLKLYEVEQPEHEVTISHSFYLSIYEVTLGDWKNMMGQLPESMPVLFEKSDRQPAINVSWYDAQKFITTLNSRHDGYQYRLPTEAEWEYACRAGAVVQPLDSPDPVAWYGNNSGHAAIDSLKEWSESDEDYERHLASNGNATHEVGTRLPNSWGVYDMRGNVWEWCADVFHNTYTNAPSDGSAWLSGSNVNERVVRGGSWRDGLNWVRPTSRLKLNPALRQSDVGFRIVATPQE